LTTKKRTKDEGESKRPAKKQTATKAPTSRAPAGRAPSTSAPPAKRPGAGARPSRGAAERRPAKTGARTPRPAGGSKPPARRGPARGEARAEPRGAASALRSPASPRIRASHSTVPDAPASGGGRKLRALSVDTGPRRPSPAAGREGPTHAPSRGAIAPKVPGTGPRKAPLGAPKRTAAAGRRTAEAEVREPGPSSAARELALALAAAAIDKKAIGIEILDVTGKVDYADFLVVMTGRSDRHVHSIATGIEEAMRARKLAPLSMEGLSTANWVLIDFSDVVVHVFQEEARALYDIEGLWIDAGRIPVPDAEQAEGGPGAGHDAPHPYAD